MSADIDDPEEEAGEGAALNLMDVSIMLKAEWKANTESTIAQC